MTQQLNGVTQEEVLDDDVLQTLAAHCAPIEMPAELNARLRQRVMAVTELVPSAKEGLVTVRASEGEWVNIAPHVDIKVLADDASYRTLLYRFGPGGKLPPHGHRGDEECIVLGGEILIGDLPVRSGDYHLAKCGTAHAELYSETGALLFVRHAREPRTNATT